MAVRRPAPFVRDAANVCLQFRGWRQRSGWRRKVCTTNNKAAVSNPARHVNIYLRVSMFFSVGTLFSMEATSAHRFHRLVKKYGFWRWCNITVQCCKVQCNKTNVLSWHQLSNMFRSDRPLSGWSIMKIHTHTHTHTHTHCFIGKAELDS